MKIRKAGIGRSYTGYIVCQASLLRITVSYTVFRRKWDRVNKIYHTAVQSQQEANKVMLHKGNTGNLKSITNQSHSGLLFMGKC